MITPDVYKSLPSEERRLWHSHVYEVKSGMLIMQNSAVPQAAWELAGNREMEQVVTLYGKVYHLWQTDISDEDESPTDTTSKTPSFPEGEKVPLGEPQLMTSYTADGQLDFGIVEKRDLKFGTDYKRKRTARSGIPLPTIHTGKPPIPYSCWALS
jgi:hypothetical protein